MPEKKLKSPKETKQKTLKTTRRTTYAGAMEPAEFYTKVVNSKGRSLTSQIPVAKKQGQLESELKLVKSNEKATMDRGKEGSPVGKRTPVKASKQNRNSMSSTDGSPGSVKSSSASSSPYFLRSKGNLDPTSSPEGLEMLTKRRKIRKRTPKSKNAGVQERDQSETGKRLPQDSPKRGSEKIPVFKKSASVRSADNKNDDVNEVVGRKQNEVTKIHRHGIIKIRRDSRRTMAVNEQAIKDLFPSLVVKLKRSPMLSHGEVAEKEKSKNTSVGGKMQKVEVGKKRKREKDDSGENVAKRAKVSPVDADLEGEEIGEKQNLVVAHQRNRETTPNRGRTTESIRARSDWPVESEKEQRKQNVSPMIGDGKKGKEKQQVKVIDDTLIVNRNHSAVPYAEVAALHNTSSPDAGLFRRSPDSLQNHSGENARQSISRLTADIHPRKSWSAHLYDSLVTPLRALRRPSDKPEVSAVKEVKESTPFPDLDFQMNWDTSAVKEQLLSGLVPRKSQEFTRKSNSHGVVGSNEATIGSLHHSNRRGPIQIHDSPMCNNKSVAKSPGVRNTFSVRGVGDVVGSLGQADLFKQQKKKFTAVRRRSSSVTPSFSPALSHTAFRVDGFIQPRQSIDRFLPTAEPNSVPVKANLELNDGSSVSGHSLSTNGGFAKIKEMELTEGSGKRSWKKQLCLAVVAAPVLVVGIAYMMQLSLSAWYLGDLF